MKTPLVSLLSVSVYYVPKELCAVYAVPKTCVQREVQTAQGSTQAVLA